MEKTFRILATGDMHGMLYPYDFTTHTPAPGSLARVAAYVGRTREAVGDSRVILLDNGDLLQGQPPVYFYNFVDTDTPHIAARMLRYLRYDAQTAGNHDIETGHSVYDRYRADLSPIPLLGANAIDRRSGEPYFTPYTVIEREGVRFAVIGLITPAIPAWLPEPLWVGMEFMPPVDTARRWMEHVRRNENADVVVGLFHSGYESTHLTWKWHENISARVAREVPGFDIIIMGHDHRTDAHREPGGPLMLNAGAHATDIAEATVTVSRGSERHNTVTHIEGRTVTLTDCAPDAAFLKEFEPERIRTMEHADRIIGRAEGDFSIRDAYFGPSAFMELVHTLQTEITNAEISIAAPTSFDATLRQGALRMSDMFNLYRYENQLCTLSMSGEEIRNLLEMSYNLWTAVMRSPDDPLLKFSSGNPVKGDYPRLINPTYNFDSAYGIIYTVDVTKPKGKKINILSMADGAAFDLSRRYSVAVNSYRANGGGELITRGAGISHDEIRSRIISATTHDLRYYMTQSIERRGVIRPTVTPNWSFIPRSITSTAIPRDRQRLFPQATIRQ